MLQECFPGVSEISGRDRLWVLRCIQRHRAAFAVRLHARYRICFILPDPGAVACRSVHPEVHILPAEVKVMIFPVREQSQMMMIRKCFCV